VTRVFGWLMVGLLCAASAAAQGSVDAERVYLWNGGSARVSLSSGSGAPSMGTTGDLYLDYATGELYTKRSGVWTVIPRLEAANAWTAAQAFNAGWTGTTGSLTSTLHVGGNFDVNTNKFTVAGSSGNTLIAGTLGVTGALDQTGTATVHADVLPSVGYTSNLGSLTTKFLGVYGAELWVETLVAAQTQATIGGRILVAPTNLLTANLAPAATVITVKYNNLASGHRIRLEANGAVEWMAVTSGAGGSAGAYTYSVTRNLDGSGADTWSSGDAIVNTRTTGDGFIDMYSVSGVISGTGPTIVGNIRTGTTYNDIAPRWGVGNLNNLCGYAASDIYGAFFGDCGASNITIDATNGFRIRDGVTNKLVMSGGNLTLTGDIVMSTSGVFRAGKTACATGTGWWLDYNAGTPQFCIGNPSGNLLKWDGTDLTLVSLNLTIGSSGVAITDSTTFQSTRGYGFVNAIGTNQSVYGTYATSTNTPSSEIGVLNRGTDTSANPYRVRLEAQSDTRTATILLQAYGSGLAVTSAYGITMSSFGLGILMSANLDLSGAGLQVGAATGGNLGSGKINVAGDIYKNNTAYTNPDYVFEHWATGKVERFAKNDGAATYTGLMPLDDLQRYVREHYRFPLITDGPVGMFGRGDIALALTEQNTLYIFQLDARLRALEQTVQGGGR
jgi:hypothetical protein